jgi:hypothetical protein
MLGRSQQGSKQDAALELLLKAQDTDSAVAISQAALCVSPHWKLGTLYPTKKLGSDKETTSSSLTWSRGIAASLETNHCLKTTLLAASRSHDVSHMLAMIAHATVPVHEHEAVDFLRAVLAPAARLPEPFRCAAHAFVENLPGSFRAWHRPMMTYLTEPGGDQGEDASMEPNDSRTLWLRHSVYLAEQHSSVYAKWEGVHNVHAVRTLADTGFVLVHGIGEVRLSLEVDDDSIVLTQSKVGAKTRILIETRGVPEGTDLVVQVFSTKALYRGVFHALGDGTAVTVDIMGRLNIVTTPRFCIIDPDNFGSHLVLMSCTLVTW